jgi:hypothetical protein
MDKTSIPGNLSTEDRARVAANARWHQDYARDIRYRKIEAAIREALDYTPSLTDEQCTRLADLLGAR